MMEYCIEKCEQTNYGGLRRQIWKFNKEDWFNHAYKHVNSINTGYYTPDPNYDPYYHITTKVIKKLFRRDQWLLALDCDSQEDLFTTLNILKFDKIGYGIIESSPTKYWVITDYIDIWKKINSKLETIPGVDTNYIKFCQTNRRICLRGLPNSYGIPQFTVNELKNPIAQQFYNDFKQHYNSKEIERYIKLVILNEAKAEGRIMDLAADPDFEI